jgi:AcrR family transcriptional regulator
VPKTRTQLDRDEKVAAIVDAARRRLLDGGYESLSVVGIARELGVAQNAVYWYFPTKDHLFVAAVDAILRDIFDRKPRSGPVVDRVVWVVDRLQELQPLRVTMRDRAARSEVIAAYEREVLELFRLLLVGALGDDVDDVDDTVELLVAVCEGILLRELSRPRRVRLVRESYRRLVSG